MKKHIKELTISDVMVIIINQQQTTDHTKSLKQYLYNTQKIEQEATQAQQIILLPDFATHPLLPEEIISYHFDKQRTSYQQILNYESLLEGIDKNMKKVIQHSGQACLLSNQMIGELKTKLEESYQLVTKQRRPVTQLLAHIKSKYLAISHKMTVIFNMQKTLDVMKFWKQTKISSVITIQPNKIQTYSDIASILQTFDHIGTVISAKKEQFTHFNNLIMLVQERKKLLIRTIYLNALNCIVDYSTEKDLTAKLAQYLYIAQKGLLSQIDGNDALLLGQKLSKQEDFLKMVELNIQQMTQNALKRKNFGPGGVQSLKQDNYVDFYESLTLQYSHYFSNWHKVTTYHMQNNNKSKDYFIKYRTLVFNKMLQKIQLSMKTSKKLMSLGLFRMKKLFKCLNNFMEFGQQWMGKCRTNLKSIIKEKLQNQIANYSKTKNGQLKRHILEDFARINIEKEIKTTFDFDKYKQFVLQDILNIIKEVKKIRQNSQQIQSTQQTSHHLQKISNLEQDSLEQDVAKFYQKLNTKFGLSFFKLTVQYRLRQQQLTQQPQITLVYQHLQFVIVVLYKTFVPNYMRAQLQNQTYNLTFRTNKINVINNAIFKNNVDDEVILAVNKLRHNFNDRTNFGYLYDLISEIGNRYQALNLAQNPTLLFNQSEKYQQELCEMSKTFLQIVNQVYGIVQYLQYLFTRNAFIPRDQAVQEKVSLLKQVIYSLVLLYFTSFYQTALKKYYSQVLPIFLGIKYETKKKNDITMGLKQYRSKLTEVYNRFAIHRGIKSTGFHSILVNKQNQYFYKFAIDMFSRVEKVNDDARQILKQQPAQLHKITGIDRLNCSSDTWPVFTEFYLQVSKQRSNKMLEEAIEKTALVFPIQWWKSNLIWYFNDCSTKQKKEFFLKAVQIYLNKLINLPNI